QIRPVRDDQQTSLARIDIARDLARALKKQIGHHRMIPYRLAIFPDLTIRAFSDPIIQFKLPRNYSLRKITLADEIRHDVNFVNQLGIEQEQRVAQARFFFPKGALDVGKDLSTPNLCR